MKPSLFFSLWILWILLFNSYPAFCENLAPDSHVEDDLSTTQRDSAYGPIAAAVITAMGDRHKLALIKPEKEGTDRSLYDLEQWLEKKLERRAIEVLASRAVIKCGGIEFALTPQGIGHIAERCSCPAALYIRWKKQGPEAEVNLLMAGPKGETLLQLSLDVPHPPPPMEYPLTQPRPTSEPLAPADGAVAKISQAPKQIAPEDIFKNRKLSITGKGDSWEVVQNGKPIGELDLAKFTARQNLMEQMQKEISHLETLRTTAIIMTIGGFVALGFSLPMINSDGDTKIAGEITAATGAAVGIAGSVMWWLWGDEATRAGGPDPVHHLLTPEQAHELVQSFNSSLRRELQLDSDSESKGINWYINPGLGGLLCAGISLRF